MPSRKHILVAVLAMSLIRPALGGEPDLVFHNGKVVTVDKDFSIHQAIAVRDGRITRVGADEEILDLSGPTTTRVDLEGKLVLPGLMDSHTHPTGAAMFEFDHRVPDMRSIADVLDYVRARAEEIEEGEWIFISQVFITRLRERRYPTRAELDEAAPRNPVAFRTGPDASLNTLALKRSGIDRDFTVPEGRSGKVERDPQTGEPTGLLRDLNWAIRYEAPASARRAMEQDRYDRVLALFRDYNSVGVTAIADRDCSLADAQRYQRMLENGDLPLRIACSRSLGAGGDPDSVIRQITAIAREPQVPGDAMLRTVGVKMYLDGGMLTGSARMREPWGVSRIYSIDDPEYKGVFRTDPSSLVPIITAAVSNRLQFTAHSVGDGAVHAMIDAYFEVGRTQPLRETRPCITHCNFMSGEAVDLMGRHGIVADIQPAWLWLDAGTLRRQFGEERLRWFQPLKSLFDAGVVVGGGSDHMQKIGSLRAVNPYNPWLGMWITLTRQARDEGFQLHGEEALSREQAIRFYTSNNAHILFLDQDTGTLEPGKFADLIVIDRDILTCPVDEVRGTRVLRTYLAGKLVHERARVE